MDIFQVRVYQSVTFEGRSENYFNAEGRNGKSNLDLTILPDLNMVKIQSPKDAILVPFTNVSCLYLNTEKRKQTVEQDNKNKKAKSGLKASEIKKPR